MSPSIQLLPFGRVDIPGPELFWMSAWDEWFPLTFQGALIRGEDFRLLVNTGPPKDLSQLNEYWASRMGERVLLRRDEGEFILEHLASLGVSADEITHVVLTPLENYTVSNVPSFTKAEICLSQRGWIHFHTTHSHPHHNRAAAVPEPILVHMVTEAWPRVRLLRDEEVIVPGVRAWWAGVHNRASLVIEVETAQGIVGITDIFLHIENFERNHPIGINESLQEAIDAHERVLASCDIVVPLTDPKNFDRFPGGLIE